TYGIVPFRLPIETALWEAEQVVELGAEVRTNVRVGRDLAMDALLAEYDAVVLACGMGGVPQIGIPGEDLAGVWDALEFIEEAKLGRDVGALGSRIAVIGAGNTAIDALTCSRRIARQASGGGEARVTMYYRRGERQMSAYGFEYDFAKQEGIEFRFFCAPTRILGEGGRVKAIEFVRTRLDASESGEAAVPVSGTEFVEPIDTVVRAIGQSRLVETFDRLGIAHDGGVVRVDESLQTTRPGVYAAGDCIFAKGTREAMVVEAAEQGKRAARSIDTYLRGGA
ncbi:MAG: FAD-dependent oxidoreductase, partial [Vulcanimicrobiaceae bacterium]